MTMSECVNRGRDLTLSEREGILEMDRDAFIKNKIKWCKPLPGCVVQVTPPPQHILKVQVTHGASNLEGWLVLQETPNGVRNHKITSYLLNSRFLKSDWVQGKEFIYTSPDHTVQFVFIASALQFGVCSEDSFWTRVHFVVVPETTPILKLSFSTTTTGSLSTPLWDGQTKMFLQMETWASITLPADHVIMVSLFKIDLPGTVVGCNKAYVGFYWDKNATDPLWVVCGVYSQSPVLFDSEDGKIINTGKVTNDPEDGKITNDSMNGENNSDQGDGRFLNNNLATINYDSNNHFIHNPATDSHATNNPGSSNFITMNKHLFNNTIQNELVIDNSATTRPVTSSVTSNSIPNSDIASNKHVNNNRALHVKFKGAGSDNDKYSGFKFHFSFHSRLRRPQKLADGRWNCTQEAGWEEIKQHFQCDLISDCAGHEDEAECPYTTSRCGVGRISLGSRRCYLFPQTSPPHTLPAISWEAVEEKCREYGGKLASLVTPGELRRARELLFAAYDGHVAIGLIPVVVQAIHYFYRNMWIHPDGTIAHFTDLRMFDGNKKAAAVRLTATGTESRIYTRVYSYRYLCSVPPVNTSTDEPPEQLDFPKQNVEWRDKEHFINCPAGHLTHTFLACDEHSACWVDTDDVTSSLCPAPLTPLPPSFVCDNGVQHVPYTLVCDDRADCSDNSDEEFCVFALCDPTTHFDCTKKGCVKLEVTCDDVPNCQDGSDEVFCNKDILESDSFYKGSETAIKPPAVLVFHRLGKTLANHPINTTAKDSHQINTTAAFNNTSEATNAFSSQFNVSMDGEFHCPDTHFQCPGNGFCLPVFVRCNGFLDCPNHEDEVNCPKYRCPGFYRCRRSTICVHQSNLCDGDYQCPERDDELLCNNTCPEGCKCYGLSFHCPNATTVLGHPDIRYLQAASSRLEPAELASNKMLIYLGLARCKLQQFPLVELPNLHTLDLSANRLTIFSSHHLDALRHLRVLILASNPLTSLFQNEVAAVSAPRHTMQPNVTVLHLRLTELDLSSVVLRSLDLSQWGGLPNLQVLNLSNSVLDRILGNGFQNLTRLRVLDLRGCPVTEFSTSIFSDLADLQLAFADNFVLCCSEVLPQGFYLGNCITNGNELSSCSQLLSSSFYRWFVLAFAIVTVLGNFIQLVIQVPVVKTGTAVGFEVLLVSLFIFNLMMGVYMTIIAVADHVYDGEYLWNDVHWRRSSACSAAGFLGLMSHEVSRLATSLVTLDRLLTTLFPFASVHFSKRSSILASAGAWAFGLIVAAVPLLPTTSHWGYYSHTGLCMPLPISTNDVPGAQKLPLNVMIVFNSCVAILVATGQLFVYAYIQKSNVSMPRYDTTTTTNVRNDLALTRSIATLVLTDVLCWCVVGMTKALSVSGYSISDNMNVALAVLVMPLSSALNPFLFTLVTRLERQAMETEERLKKSLLAGMQRTAKTTRKTEKSVVQRVNVGSVEAVTLDTWIRQGVISNARASTYLNTYECSPPVA